MMNQVLLFLSLFYFLNSNAFTISSRPFCSVYTPDSILNDKHLFKPLFVGKRQRYATCTGAAWFHNNYLAVLNLYGNKLIIYRFNEQKNEFTLLQEINNTHGMQLRFPEHLDVSPDGRLLAVANSKLPSINLYSIDRINHLINPIPIFSQQAHGLIHNVRFTPDGKYLAYASFDTEKSLCIYRITNKANTIYLRPIYIQANNEKLLKLKAINFTHNNHYAILAYAFAVNSTLDNPCESLLVIHRFNDSDGSLGDRICSVKGNFSTEDITLADNDHAVVLSDQNDDLLVFYPFDPDTGYIDEHYMLMKNPEAQLSFPHGVAVSPDGHYLAVANYGDDKFNLYQIQ
jgi:6-phosphogluconolactonase (cycloisomerase 2 family)